MPSLTQNQIFIGYSHKDIRSRQDLEINLKPFLRGGSIVSWSDEQIAAGSEWFNEIQSAVTRWLGDEVRPPRTLCRNLPADGKRIPTPFRGSRSALPPMRIRMCARLQFRNLAN
jgi:hypothetical protein